MGHYIRILLFIISGIVLLWFGFSFLLRHRDRKTPPGFQPGKKEAEPKTELTIDQNARLENAVSSRSCPVCSAQLFGSEQVKTTAFPPLIGSKDRLMHIKGCVHCLIGDNKRTCPVCNKSIDKEDFLVARIFERHFRKSHVHVQGCTRCCKVK